MMYTMGMYVDVVPNRSSPPAVLLRESRRVGGKIVKTTIANLSSCPPQAIAAGKRTYRSILIEDEELEFSNGFTDLHTASYTDILAGGGFGLQDARPGIEAAHDIRNAAPRALTGEYHPMFIMTVLSSWENVMLYRETLLPDILPAGYAILFGVLSME